MNDEGYLGPVGGFTRKPEAGSKIQVIVAASSFENAYPEVTSLGRGALFQFAGTFKEAVRALAQFWRRLLMWQSVAVTLVGMFGLLLGFAFGTDRLSYDASSVLRFDSAPRNLVIASIDDSTFVQLGRELDGTLSRAHVARLIDRLTRENVRLVILDLLLAEPAHSKENDDRLAEAIRSNGRVILGALYDSKVTTDGVTETAIRPIAKLREFALGWGVLNMPIDPDHAVRRLKTRWSTYPSAVWHAATNLGVNLAGYRGATEPERWLHYYERSADLAFRTVPFHDAMDEAILPTGYFSNKVVIVGSRSLAKPLGAGVDQFGTPWTRFGEGLASGAAVHATSLANLLDGSWLRRVPSLLQIGMVGVLGFCLAWLGAAFRNPVAVAAILLSSLSLIAGSCCAAATLNYWWDWCIPVTLQTTVAIVGCLWIRKPRFRG